MFRYERPQKGRQRQFHQLDAEILGVSEPLADIEVIALGATLLDALGMLDVTELELNTLGDPESRAAYRAALVDYFEGHREALSEDSLLRLERNPLRILDSKDAGDRAVIDDAPLMGDYLSAASADMFGAVRAGLDRLGIAYRLNPKLVRGLDYYAHAAFEFTTRELGAQGAVVAGGRYDGLIAAMGGPPTPATGWAAGIERMAMLIGEAAPPKRPVAVVAVGAGDEGRALELAHELRHAGFTIELGYRGNISRRLKRANRLNASAAVLVGEDERARNAVVVRDLDTGEQVEVPLADLHDRLARYR